MDPTTCCNIPRAWKGMHYPIYSIVLHLSVLGPVAESYEATAVNLM